MLKFPFEDLRPGQSRIINAVEEAIREQKQLMIQAPTGFGKTVAILFGALKEIENSDKRILFLTAKRMHQNVVYDTIEKISRKSGKIINYAGINGKNTMCLLDNKIEPDIFNDFCRTMREKNLCDFYSRTYKSGKTTELAEMAIRSNVSKPENAIEIGRKFGVCPYEISMQNAKSSKVIIANYFHVFNPAISYAFFTKLNLKPEETILIIDEAHNLPSKIIDTNSASISINRLEKAYQEVSLFDEQLSRKVKELILAAKSIEDAAPLDIKNLFDKEDLVELEDIIEKQENLTKIPFSLSLRKLIITALNADESYLQYGSKEDGKIKVNVVSLDPSNVANNTIRQFYSTILFSGTLKPMDMFANLLGIPECKKIELDNYFPIKNRLIINDISTTSKFSSREESSWVIAEKLERIIKNFKYSLIVFFPSYEFMNSVLSKIGNKSKIIVEKQHMTRNEQLQLLSELYESDKALFCVIGGNFGESVDIRNEHVKMAIIVGVPFEPPSIRLKALQNYYQNKFKNGFEYAQVLPTMIKTMQAAGRILRSEKDRAIIVLMDYRFSSKILNKYLPSDTIETDDVETEINKFIL